MSPEAELAELTSAMLATADRVIAVVSELGGGEGGGGGGEEGEKGGNGDLWEVNSTDEYMQTMSPLQFGRSNFFLLKYFDQNLETDTYEFVEEDESGKLSVLVPFHYENRLQPSHSSSYGPRRARRLAQEVSALATSLPLSSSSSVFVRCDENRLDVMKVGTN